MFSDSFKGKIVTARNDYCGLLGFRQDDLLEEQRIGFGAVELLRHPSRFADLAHFDKVCGFQRPAIQL